MPRSAPSSFVPALSLLVAAPLWAQTAAQPAAPPAPASAASAPAQVEITGGRGSDVDQRRQSTAAKIIIGREQIDKFGDATLGEVLRRLPGVSAPGRPGRGGAPRMRGLGGGYTQLLIDGERVAPGFSLESLTPEQVERIEILRAPTAETGARAIAGTINIITREGYRRRLNDLRMGGAYENGRWSRGVNWSHNDSLGALTYTLTGSVFVNRRASSEVDDTVTEDLSTGLTTADKSESMQTLEQRRAVHLSTRLQWRLGDGGDMLMLNPSVFHQERDSERRSTLTHRLSPTPALYDQSVTTSAGQFTSTRLNGQWRQRLGDAVRGEANGFASHWRSRSESARAESLSGLATPSRLLDDRSQSRESTLKLGTKFTALLGGNEATPGSEHSVVSGLEVEAIQRNEVRDLLQDGLPLLADYGDNLKAQSTRLAAYAQNEWTISPHWAAHAGLRWEGIETVGDPGDGTRPRNLSSVWTPLLHAVWKPDPKGRDQVRFSLTRSYKAPSLSALIARPSINSRFAVSGSNEPTHPDRAGNAHLTPELATGLDVAYEVFLKDGGLLSANLFHRQIQDLMRSVVTLETVPWSPVPRWVSRQDNVGDAVTSGLELEAKARLDQLWADAPRIDLRANASFYRSRVAGVRGPDNRLDQQAGATANLGADYRFKAVPMSVGGNLNWVPGYRTQVSDSQVTTVSTRRVLDAFALLNLNPSAALRLTASNLAPGDSVDSNTVVVGSAQEITTSRAPSYINWQLRLELKL